MCSRSGREGGYPRFPFLTPYATQLGVMDAVYATACSGGQLGDGVGKVGVIESPTGTGKTIALLCAALHWLEDCRNEKKIKDDVGHENADDEETELPEWLVESEKNFMSSKAADEDVSSDDNNESTKNASDSSNAHFHRKRRKVGDKNGETNCTNRNLEKTIIYTSRTHSQLSQVIHEFNMMENKYMHQLTKDNNLHGTKKKVRANSWRCVHLGSRAQLCINEKVSKQKSTARMNEMCIELNDMSLKSQKKREGEAAIAHWETLITTDDNMPNGEEDHLKNDALQIEVPTNKVTDRDKSAKRDRKQKDNTNGMGMCGCHYHHHKTQIDRDAFQQQIFNVDGSNDSHCNFRKVLDIEELADLGRKKSICPYYSSRSAALDADIILLPYSSLIHAQTRESLQLSVSNALIIIDEAHNIAESVENVHSALLTLRQLTISVNQVKQYMNKFMMRLNPNNRRMTQTLYFLGEAFEKMLLNQNRSNKENDDSKSNNNNVSCHSVNDFLFSLNIDNINLFELLNWIKEYKVAFKISGCRPNEKSVNDGNDNNESNNNNNNTSSIFSLVAFLNALTQPDDDGRIIIRKKIESKRENNHVSRSMDMDMDMDDFYMKYLLLDSSSHFEELIQQSHAVVLAGGTLPPLTTIQQQLMPSINISNIIHFSGSHVISSNRMLCLPLSSGPTGTELELTFHKRENNDIIDEIGRVLINLSRVVPNGMIVFFPSYRYSDRCYERWKYNGMLNSLTSKKAVFREPRIGNVDNNCNQGSSLDETLSAYSKAAISSSGAILLAIIGGKMSEGINFADAKGRCVVIVGLPYGNTMDPELLEKVRHLDAKSRNTSFAKDCVTGSISASQSLSSWGKAGREYYEACCMKAVNQSIGRAIRHKNDYAAIILVDTRYHIKRGSENGPISRLPKWIRETIPHIQNASFSFPEMFGQLNRFYSSIVESKSLPT